MGRSVRLHALEAVEEGSRIELAIPDQIRCRRGDLFATLGIALDAALALTGLLCGVLGEAVWGGFANLANPRMLVLAKRRFRMQQLIEPLALDGEHCARVDGVRPFNGPVNGRPARLLLGHALDRPRRDLALIALVANARRWSRMLLSGDATSVLEITEREGLGKGVISRTPPLAFLAPDIAEAILDGCQPDGLTAGGLYRLADLPRDWDAQRKLLGFSRAA